MSTPLTLNPYPYALDNPILHTDPSGENPLIVIGLLGGLLGGSLYGYGSQVLRNLNQGMCFWSALSTDIDAGQIAFYAGVGTLLGLGIGGVMIGGQLLAINLGIGATSGTITSQTFNNLSQAANYGIQQATQLRKAISGTGLQAHHIIEQRLAPALGQNASLARKWLSVAVTPEEHRVFTNA